MGCRVVCIARVTAAGGEAIGHAVSERLGFRYVDDEVITVAAETAGIDPAALENVEHEQGLFARLLEAIVTTPRAPEGLIARRPSNSYYDEAGPPPAPLARDDLRQLIQGAIRETRDAGRPSSSRTRRRSRWRANPTCSACGSPHRPRSASNDCGYRTSW